MSDTELLNWLESQIQKCLGRCLWYEAVAEVHLGKPLREALSWAMAEDEKTSKLSPLAKEIYEVIRQSGYLAVWAIAEELGVPCPANFCGSGEWTESDDAMKELVDGGLIEELSDLHCRYRIIER